MAEVKRYLDEVGLQHLWGRIIDQIQADISVLERLSNKVTSITSGSTDVQYPSAKAVYDLVRSGAIIEPTSELDDGKFIPNGTIVDVDISGVGFSKINNLLSSNNYNIALRSNSTNPFLGLMVGDKSWYVQASGDYFYLGNTSSNSLRIDQSGNGNFQNGSVTALSFIKSGGTSSQFLKADGSVDSNAYITSAGQTQLSKGTTTGAGNAVTDINVSNHEITLVKGQTFLTSQDISGKADKSEAIGSLTLTLDSSNYRITLSGTKVNGDSFTVSDVIDLPIESVVVGGRYDDATKKVILTLQNGNTIEFSVADLVAGLQSEITPTNKLSADLISGGTTNQVVTQAEKDAWNAKYDKPSGGIPKTDLDSSVQTSLGKADTALQEVNWGDITGTLDNQTDLKNALDGKQPTGNYVTTDTTQTISAQKSFNKRVNFLGTGDANAIYLTTDTRIDVNGTTNTVLGFASGTFLINHANYNLRLRGNGTRPTYNTDTNPLALLSDVPTKVSELTNDAGYITQHQDISGKADKVSGATSGNFAGLDSNGNLIDSGKNASDFGTYSKPSSGIPKTDLESSVQNSLDKADTAYQKPSSGIPLSDLSSEVTDDIDSKLDRLTASTDNAIVRFDGTQGNIQNSSVLVDDNGGVTLNKLIVQGTNTSNSTRIISSSSANDITIQIGNVSPLVVNSADVSPGNGHNGTINLGSTSTYWNNVYGIRFITSGGTSSQFLKADGSIDSSAYITSAGQTQLSKGTTSGSGNAVTDISVSNHQITLVKGQTFLTSQDVSSKADKVQNATNGNFAGLDSNGNLTDSGKKASDFANVSHSHGNITNDGKIQNSVDIANGDGLVITDASDNHKIVRSTITFDGSTTTQALSKNGTWTTFYQKPSSGIPKTDLDSTVQTSLGLADTAIQDISGKADKVSGATNGNFAGLDANGNLIDSGKKASDFGTYSKPISGIPKTDLESSVQTSLNKADTALQSYTETDPVFSSSVAAGIGSSDINYWNNKQEKIRVTIGRMYRANVSGSGTISIQGNSGQFPTLLEAGTYTVKTRMSSSTQNYTLSVNYGGVTYSLTSENGLIDDERELTLPAGAVWSGSVTPVASNTVCEINVISSDDVTVLAPVAISGSYNDLSNKPTIPAAQIQSDWNQTNTSAKDYIKNKPTIPATQVNSDWNATSGVAEILNKPDIPTVSQTTNSGTSIQIGNTNYDIVKNDPIGNETTIAPSAKCVFDAIPKNVSDLNNDSGFITSSDIPVTSVNGQTGDVTISIGVLNTNNSSAQTISSSESFGNTINLHKVSKTGSYNDLLNKPSIPPVDTAISNAEIDTIWDNN